MRHVPAMKLNLDVTRAGGMEETMANYNNGNRRGNNRVEFKIEEHLGKINHNSSTDWNKEVNIVRWNDGPSKLDIREWDESHERMSKGVTLSEDEMDKLITILSRRFPEKIVEAKREHGFGRRSEANAEPPRSPEAQTESSGNGAAEAEAESEEDVIGF